MEFEQRPVTVTVTLDKRRAKQDGTYPLRLYVWDSAAKVGKYLSQLHGEKLPSLTGEEFKGAWEAETIRPLFKPLNEKLSQTQQEAQEIVGKLEQFTFDGFVRMAAIPKGEGVNVFHHYENQITDLRKKNQHGTAETYQLSRRSLRAYAGKDKVTFSEVTPRWLQGFEDYMVSNGRSLTTVSIYVRTLRTIYRRTYLRNSEDARYPFGDVAEGKYQLPPSNNSRDNMAAKAFPQEFIGQLKAAKAATPEQERARDFFLFSYYANGMNTRDMAKLTFEQFAPNPDNWDRFTYKREKTKRNRKSNKSPKVVSVFARPELQDIYIKHRNRLSETGYVFPFLNNDMNEEAARIAAKNFTRAINQNLKLLCEANGLQVVSTYAARHSFITHIIQNGASIETAAEMAGHENTRTTQGYYSGQREETMKRAHSTLPT